MLEARSYLAATRHPWACVIFVLPLLIAYEVGMVALALDQPEQLRNGADVWVRWVLATVGLRGLLSAPCLLAATLLAWSAWKRADRPRDVVGLWVGMTTESAMFAVLLWGGCHLVAPLLYRLGVQMSAGTQADAAMPQLLCFVGAGIYEETLFRLLLFSGLFWLLERIDVPWPGPGVLAALVSALLFSAAHNIGRFGEDFQPFVFAFRTVAGLYFVALYRFRGFGVVVGGACGLRCLGGPLGRFLKLALASLDCDNGRVFHNSKETRRWFCYAQGYRYFSQC